MFTWTDGAGICSCLERSPRDLPNVSKSTILLHWVLFCSSTGQSNQCYQTQLYRLVKISITSFYSITKICYKKWLTVHNVVRNSTNIMSMMSKPLTTAVFIVIRILKLNWTGRKIWRTTKYIYISKTTTTTVNFNLWSHLSAKYLVFSFTGVQVPVFIIPDDGPRGELVKKLNTWHNNYLTVLWWQSACVRIAGLTSEMYAHTAATVECQCAFLLCPLFSAARWLTPLFWAPDHSDFPVESPVLKQRHYHYCLTVLCCNSLIRSKSQRLQIKIKFKYFALHSF